MNFAYTSLSNPIYLDFNIYIAKGITGHTSLDIEKDWKLQDPLKISCLKFITLHSKSKLTTSSEG